MTPFSASAARKVLSDSGGATIGYTPVADANYVAVASDRQVSFTALTATRTVSLPDSATFPAGETFFVSDENGQCSPTRRILPVPRSGTADQIGDGSPIALTSAYQGVGFRLGGGGRWSVVSTLSPRRKAYLPVVVNQYVQPEDYGQWFLWNLAGNGSIGLPTGATVFPGWWCQVQVTGAPAGYGTNAVLTAGYANRFILNGREQVTSDGTTTYRSLVVIGGGEEFRFTWTGSEYLIEVVQSPTQGHFTYRRVGSGDYVETPTAFTLIPGSTTDGSNAQAATPYGLGMYAPCDGLYRIMARTRFYIGQDNTYGAGAIALSGAVADAYDQYGGLHLKTYLPYDYQDVSPGCTKRLRFGEIVAAYKFATNPKVTSRGASEVFTAELLSRG